MKINKFNISKPKKYNDKSGEEKTQWNNIGTMTEFIKDDGSVSRIIEIPAFGLDANIFPFTDKNVQSGTNTQETPNNSTQEQIDANYGIVDDINVEEIPFN